MLIGAILPLQGLLNARLGTHIGGPVPAAFVSFLVGTVMLGLYLLATRTPVALQGSLKLPPWIWAGGVLGAVYGLTVRSRNWAASLGMVLKSVAGGELRWFTNLVGTF